MSVLKIKKNGVWENVSGASGHTHTKDDIIDFPDDLLANGGDADTVDGKHASDFATAAQIENIQTLVGDTAVADQISTAIDALNIDNTFATKGEVLALSNDVANELISEATFARAAEKANADAIDAVEATIGTVSNGKTVVGMIGDVSSVNTELAGRVTTVEGQVGTLIGDDANKSVRTIANEELAAQLVGEGAAESLNTLQEIADWIQNNPNDAAKMNSDIAKLQELVGDTAVTEQIESAVADKADVEHSHTLNSFGITVSAADINKLSGVNSNIQTQLNNKAPSGHTHSGYASSSHSHNANELPTIPISKGGTGATSADGALSSLGVKTYVASVLSDFDGGGVGESTTGTSASPDANTTVTCGTGAEIFNDYRERDFDPGTDPVSGSSCWYAISGNVASGSYSHAEGSKTTASGANSHAEGSTTVAAGGSCHAEGYDSRTANASACHAEGYETRSMATAAHSEGYRTLASGKYSHAEGSKTTATGEAAHAEGYDNTASGKYSHAEGSKTTASGEASHTEGYGNTASGNYSHAEGNQNTTTGSNSHVEGSSNTAKGGSSHVEGYKNSVTADSAAVHIEGYENTAHGRAAHAEGSKTVVTASYGHAEGYYTKATGEAAHAEGSGNIEDDGTINYTTASGDCSHAEGFKTTASKFGAHAEGTGSIASGNASHAEGGAFTNSAGYMNNSIASGDCSHSEGGGCTATGKTAHAEGGCTAAEGDYSHSEGSETWASGIYSHAGGNGAIASGNASFSHGYKCEAAGAVSVAFGEKTIANGYQLVCGQMNVSANGVPVGSQSDSYAPFIVGNGTSTTRSTAFQVTAGGSCRNLTGTYSNYGDYAEYFEWNDGNPDAIDRRGLFVTLDGDKIRVANKDDNYILGIISGTAAFIGNSASMSWNNKYLKDAFGTLITQEVEISESVDEATGETIPAHIVEQFVINPDYDPEQEYISRQFRSEWAPVGMLGQVVVIDDGTCVVNGYCAPSIDGIGTASDNGYRVMKRIDDTHVKVLVR